MAKQTKNPEPKKDNSVGNRQNEKAKLTAIESLPTAKMVEQNRSLQGWVYVSKEKTSKQVHPSKIDKLICEGWKQSKTAGI